MLQLPDELLLKIGQYSIPPRDEWHDSPDRTVDLCSLILTCKRICTIMRPILFQSITYRYKEDGGQERIAFYLARDRFIRNHLPMKTIKELVLRHNMHYHPRFVTELLVNQGTTAFAQAGRRTSASPGLSLHLLNIPADITQHWLEQIAHHVQHISIFSDSSNKDPLFFDSYIPLLKQLPGLTSVSMIDKGWARVDRYSQMFQYLQQANNIQVSDIHIGVIPLARVPSLKFLSIADCAFEIATGSDLAVGPWESVQKLHIDVSEFYPCSCRSDSDKELAKLVTALFPALQQLTCPLFEFERGNFSSSLQYLNLKVHGSYNVESLAHLYQAFAKKAYPALRHLILNVDWDGLMDNWYMDWRPKLPSDRCDYCKGLEDPLEEGGERDEDIGEPIYEYPMLQHFYASFCAMLDSSCIDYNISPLLDAAFYEDWMSNQDCFFNGDLPKLMPIAADPARYADMTGWLDPASRCSGLPFEPCFSGSLLK